MTFTELLFDIKHREHTRMIHRSVSHLLFTKPEIFGKKDQFPASHQIGVGWRLKNVSAFVSPTKADWIVIQKLGKAV